jgi:tetratricopeptide (TPR) repeat protein
MYDIDKLEAQWRRYRLKRILLPASAIGMVLIGGAAILWYTQGHNDTDVTTGSAVASTPPTQSVQQEASPTPASQPVGEKPTARSGGMKIVFADTHRSERAPDEKSPTKKIHIQVTEKKGHDTVRDIESRFAFAKDKDDALFLARYYYDKKQYKKALKWALETNKIDSEIEESWLIFAKAKARLGDRVEAIRILQAYYDRSGSAKAKQLLGHIRKGKAF